MWRLHFLPIHLNLTSFLNLTSEASAGLIFLPNYRSFRQRLFAEQLIPKLGTPDKQESQLERLKEYGEEEKKRKRREKAPFENEDKAEEAIETEKEILLKLLDKIHLYDEYLIDINSKRSQYQKG